MLKIKKVALLCATIPLSISAGNYAKSVLASGPGPSVDGFTAMVSGPGPSVDGFSGPGPSVDGFSGPGPSVDGFAS